MSAKYLQKECAHTDCEFWETPVGRIMVKGIVANKKVALSAIGEKGCDSLPLKM
jgi:hypothetical protein